ncbi:MAG: histone H1 [Solirubrobacterales bacterium]
MPDRSHKRPRDPNQLAKLVVDIATGDVEDLPVDSGKNPVAVVSGRRGGLRGGKARAQKLSPKQRSDIARKAANARWSGQKA